MRFFALIISFIFSFSIFSQSPNMSRRGSTPGTDVQSVYFGNGVNCDTSCSSGTCNVCNQVGSKITSVTWLATGGYNIHGIDGTKYNCQGLAVLSGVKTGVHFRPSSNTNRAYVQFYSSGTTAANVASATVTCVGNP